MTHQPDRVAQVVAWLRNPATTRAIHSDDPSKERLGVTVFALNEAADAIEAGEPFQETLGE